MGNENSALELIAEAERNRDSRNPLTAATADSDHQLFTVDEADRNWRDARRRLNQGLRTDEALLWTFVVIAGIAAALTAFAIQRNRARGSPSATAVARAEKKTPWWLALAGVALASGNIAAFVLLFPEPVAPVIALGASALAMAIHLVQLRVNARSASRAFISSVALLLALSAVPTSAGGFTKAEEAKLGRCLDSKKSDAAACKSECYGAFRPGQVDDQGRNLRDLCSLACKYKALDECCERLKLNCSK